MWWIGELGSTIGAWLSGEGRLIPLLVAWWEVATGQVCGADRVGLLRDEVTEAYLGREAERVGRRRREVECRSGGEIGV